METKREKTWLYEQYYSGGTDNNKRRSGYGINNWTGAKVKLKSLREKINFI